MKRCVNPSCETSFLFGDDRVVCPFCHRRLVDNNIAPGPEAQTALAPDGIDFIGTIEPRRAEFLRENNGTIECHGRVVEVDHHELFYGKLHKLSNSLFYGEPYQFAHQTVEYTIRVENITQGISTEVTDFCLFGSYLGRLQVGDEVIIHAKNQGNRRVIKTIYNQTIDSDVKPNLQLPAGLIRLTFLLVVLVALATICGVIVLFKTGTWATALSAITAALMPFGILGVGVWLLIRSVFPRRRR